MKVIVPSGRICPRALARGRSTMRVITQGTLLGEVNAAITAGTANHPRHLPAAARWPGRRNRNRQPRRAGPRPKSRRERVVFPGDLACHRRGALRVTAAPFVPKSPQPEDLEGKNGRCWPCPEERMESALDCDPPARGRPPPGPRPAFSPTRPAVRRSAPRGARRGWSGFA